MKNFFIQLLLIIVIFSLTSCEAIGGIFKAGVWTGVFIIAAIIGVILFIITKVGSKK